MNIHYKEKTNTDMTMLRRKCALSDIRKIAGLTQNEMAERLDVSQPAYAAFEKGGNLRVGTLRKIVSALGGELLLRVKFRGRDVELNVTRT